MQCFPSSQKTQKPKRGFFEKFHSSDFYPFIVLYYATKFGKNFHWRSWDIKLRNFGPQLGQNCPFFQLLLAGPRPVLLYPINIPYSSSLVPSITACNHLPFFKMFSNFVHFCPNFQIFCPFFCPLNNRTHVLTF